MYVEFGTSDANTIQHWSKLVNAARREYLEIDPLIGTDSQAIIHEKTELSNMRGDKITHNLRARLSGEGKAEGETQEGNAEDLSFFTDQTTIGELIHAVGVGNEESIDQMRTPFDLREEGRDALGEWWAERESQIFFTQVCGYTPQTNPKRYGFNTVTAPTTNRILRPAGVAADESLTSNHPMTLDLIDKVVVRATTGSNAMRPVREGGTKKFVMYLHPEQARQLRTNTATGQWMDITKAAMAGGGKNRFLDGALGEYNNVILRVSQDVTLGVNSSVATTSVANVRRAVLLGAQACCYGCKKFKSGTKMKWSEISLDHGRKGETGARKIFGFKKTVYNSEDFGCFVVPTYSEL